jgi:hypothetical protein
MEEAITVAGLAEGRGLPDDADIGDLDAPESGHNGCPGLG